MHRADALHPGWEFASHVGYSTPEHREAIQRLGVSPLHRLSFQSTAYQQLALVRPRPTRGSERRLEVVEAHEPPAVVDGDADDVEAQLAGRGRSRRSREPGAPPCGGPDAACAASDALAATLAAAPARARLDLTKTIVASSQTMRSSSPKRVR